MALKQRRGKKTDDGNHRELEPGDIVTFDRGVYKHYAIYKKDGRVIHKAGDDVASGWSHGNSLLSPIGATSDKSEIKEQDLDEVAKGCKVMKNNENDKKYTPLPKEVIVASAEARVGQREGYNVITNNCETFANESRYGVSESEQGDLVAVVLVVGIGALAVGVFKLLSCLVNAVRSRKA